MGFFNRNKQNEAKWEEAEGKVKGKKGKTGMMSPQEYAKWLKETGQIDPIPPPSKQKRGGKWGKR